MWAVFAINRHGWLTGHAGSHGGNAVYSGGAIRKPPLPAWADDDGSVFISISEDGKVVGGSAGSSSDPDKHRIVPFGCLCSCPGISLLPCDDGSRRCGGTRSAGAEP